MSAAKPTRPRRYDVSLSFAGEDRLYVGQVASILRGAGARVFYDEFEEAALWGKDLVDELDQIYRLESEAVVMFVSAAYLQKDWTNHERRSMLAAALRARREYVLPVRFDDTELPGMPPTMKWLDARKFTPQEFAQRVLEKLTALGVDGLSRQGPLGQPRSAGAVAWRILRPQLAADPLVHANAASIVGGRWNPIGVPMLYCSSTISTALLELLAHASPMLGVANLVAAPIRIPSTVAIETIYESSLPQSWRDLPVDDSLRQLGADWARNRRTCVLSVPSAVVPAERVLLLNPLHDDFANLEMLATEPFKVDPRLLR